MRSNRRSVWPPLLTLLSGLFARPAAAADPWVVYEGKEGPGKGKSIVLISGDEEYRSEEALPQLAKILAHRHGFRCAVLFAVDQKDGTINPNRNDNIPGLEALESADLMVIATRFRNLPDEQMKHIVKYLEEGKPVVGMRTATHAFALRSPTYERYNWNSKISNWEGGFGRRVLGETWINHHGQHGRQSTRGMVIPWSQMHPILRGIADGNVWGPTDVYTVRDPLPGDCEPLMWGQVLTGMNPTDPPVEGKQNRPMMPIAWAKTYTVNGGATGRAFTTTMGAAQDLQTEGTRRLLVNACYWALGLESAIPAKSNVDLVGEYRPHPFRTDGFTKGVKPSDLAEK
jgi:hypothetical protein